MRVLVVSSKFEYKGFSLIEMVIGIVAFSAVLTIVIGVLNPQAERSADPIFRVRAAELAQSLFNEISGKSFDEQSDRSGGLLRCGETGAPACTSVHCLGPEDGVACATLCSFSGGTRTDSAVPPVAEGSRDLWDDVDDYHQLVQSGDTIENSLGETLGSLYTGFTAEVSVIYDGNEDGANDCAIADKKLITVTITTPNGDAIPFSLYRSNF